jgi:hypothetical protein
VQPVLKRKWNRKMSNRLIVFAILGASLATADTLILKDGRTVDGSYLGGDSRRLRMAVGDRVETFDVGEITDLRFGGNSGPSGNSQRRPNDGDNVFGRGATPPPAPSAPPDNVPSGRDISPGRDRERVELVRPNNPPPPPVRNIGNYNTAEIPSGTTVVVRMIDDVDSQRDRIGQTFRASVDEPVMVNGETVIPRGADVLAKLVDDKESGKLTGRTELTMDLMSVQINGRMVDIDTQSVTQASESRTGRSAKVVGGTAALGAIIGAIAGGGKGAAIGAGAGAAAGGAAQVITKGQRVRIPSESRLTFTLQQPVHP